METTHYNHPKYPFFVLFKILSIDLNRNVENNKEQCDAVNIKFANEILSVNRAVTVTKTQTEESIDNKSKKSEVRFKDINENENDNDEANESEKLPSGQASPSSTIVESLVSMALVSKGQSITQTEAPLEHAKETDVKSSHTSQNTIKKSISYSQKPSGPFGVKKIKIETTLRNMTLRLSSQSIKYDVIRNGEILGEIITS